MNIKNSIFFLAIFASLSGGIFFLKQPAPLALCKSSKTSTPYCKFVGNASQVYVNSEGTGLVVIELPINIQSASDFGYEITSGSAFAFDLSDQNGRMMFDLTTAAFFDDKVIEIHARGVKKGYLLADRVWVR